MLKKVTPKYLVVVFDSETSADNKKSKMPEYKSNRTSEDNSIFHQLSLIKKSLDIMGIYWVEDNQNEADDVMGVFVKKFHKHNMKSFICSNDHDFVQLVSSSVSVVRGVRGEFIFYDREMVIKKFGVTPRQYADYLSLVGDVSDNIKGVKGVGKKKAVDLLTEYGDVRSIFNAFDSLLPPLKKLLHSQQNAVLSRKEFFKIGLTCKAPPLFKVERYSFSQNKIPDQMGGFLSTHWKRII